MNNLVVFYSLTGRTRNIAKKAAKALNADVAEILCPTYDPLLFRYIHAGFDSWRGGLPNISVVGKDRSPYEFALILGPVWAGHASTPVRAFLQMNKGRLNRFAFGLSCGGWRPPSAFEEMSQLAGVKPEQAFTFVETDTRSNAELPDSFSRYLNSVNVKVAA